MRPSKAMLSCLVVAATLWLGVGCRSVETTQSESQPSTARTPAPPSVGQGGGETPEGRGREITATPAITVVTSALEVETPAPESDDRAREAERLTVRATGAAGSTPAPSAIPTQASDQLGQLTESNEAEVWAAVTARWPPGEWDRAMRVAWCESRFQSWAAEPSGSHFGIYQMDSSLHGPVPSDIDGQVQQAYELWAQTGDWRHWSCS